jgi:hypothetical protein
MALVGSNRSKVVLALVIAIVLAATIAVYIATIGIKVDATRRHLIGSWTSGNNTTIVLRADRTFSATGISDCTGPVEAAVAGARLPSRLDVTRGEGTWDVAPDTNNPGVDTLLSLMFQTPQAFTLRWQAGNVTWRFHSAAVTLISNNSTMDGSAPHCVFTAER